MGHVVSFAHHQEHLLRHSVSFCRVPANNKSLKVFMVWLCLIYTVYACNARTFRHMAGMDNLKSAEVVDSMQPMFAMVLLGLNFVSLFVA